MDYEKTKVAMRLARKMERLVAEAKKHELQFIAVDDCLQIGDLEIETTWDSLIGEGNSNEFASVDATIACIGA